LHKAILYNKRVTWREKLCWVKALRSVRYDYIIDLRDTVLPFILHARKSVSPIAHARALGHRKEKHLACLRKAFPDIQESRAKICLSPSDGDKRQAHELIPAAWYGKFILVAPGAADHRKRWPEEHFVSLIQQLIKEYDVNFVAVGSQEDAAVADTLVSRFPDRVRNVCGRTSLPVLGEVIRLCRMAIVNDSGIMHMASYLDKPVVALFGPTDPVLYGPWSRVSVALRAPSQGKEDDGVLRMQALTPEQVLRSFELTDQGMVIHSG
jgi:ADP-heptose:LPS heptosyltransferase